MRIQVDEPAAWITAAGGFLMNFIVMGYLKSIGILMKEFQQYFGCSNSLIMFTTSSTIALTSLLAPVHSLVTSKFVPVRHAVMGSGALACSLMLLLFFAFSLRLWVACLGVGIGVCLSLTYSSVICKVGECFRRRRDLATGVCFAGSSAGSVLMPFAFAHVAVRYSAAGCCLLIGAYFFHLVVVGALMPTRVDPPPDAAAQPAPASADGRLDSRQRRLAVVYIGTTMLSNLSFTSQYVLLPMFAAERSVPSREVAALVAWQGAVDFGSRMLIGWLSDRWQWRKANVMLAAMTTMGATCLAAALLASLASSSWRLLAILVAYATLAGASGGLYMVSTTSVIVSFVGVANLSFVHSAACCCWALSVYPGQTALGWLKDATGTFLHSTAAAGALMLLASCCLATERLVAKGAADTAEVDAQLEKETGGLPPDGERPLLHGEEENGDCRKHCD